jgi:hypothetical protein
MSVKIRPQLDFCTIPEEPPMARTIALIEQVRKRLPRPTNYAIAKALHMDQTTLDKVLAGKHGLGTRAAVLMAEILKKDLERVLCELERDKAKTPEAFMFWEMRLKKPPTN